MSTLILDAVNAAIRAFGLPHKATLTEAEGEPVDDEILITPFNMTKDDPQIGLQIGYDYLALNTYQYDDDGELVSLRDKGMFDRDDITGAVDALVKLLQERRPEGAA